MAAIAYQHFDPLLPESQAEQMLRLCERFSRYGTYAEESIDDDFGENLSQRHDALHLQFIVAKAVVRTATRIGLLGMPGALVYTAHIFAKQQNIHVAHCGFAHDTSITHCRHRPQGDELAVYIELSAQLVYEAVTARPAKQGRAAIKIAAAECHHILGQ